MTWVLQHPTLALVKLSKVRPADRAYVFAKLAWVRDAGPAVRDVYAGLV